MTFSGESGLTFVSHLVSTITSPFFSELVLELAGPPSHFGGLSAEYLGRWVSTDAFLEEQFAKGGDFKLIVRTGELHDRNTFQKHAKDNFPLLASRGCIHFETSHCLEKY